MEKIKILDKSFIPFINEENIQQKITELSNSLNNDYKNYNPIFLAVLNGSFMFASDLFKKLTIECEICFVKLASYKGMNSTHQVITSIGLDATIHNRHIVIIEDIVDTGNTLQQFLPQIKNQQPLSLKVVTLLSKPSALIHPIKIDYCCFEIENKFVVGYGLDYDGWGRNYPAIYQLSE